MKSKVLTTPTLRLLSWTSLFCSASGKCTSDSSLKHLRVIGGGVAVGCEKRFVAANVKVARGLSPQNSVSRTPEMERPEPRLRVCQIRSRVSSTPSRKRRPTRRTVRRWSRSAGDPPRSIGQGPAGDHLATDGLNNDKANVDFPASSHRCDQSRDLACGSPRAPRFPFP